MNENKSLLEKALQTQVNRRASRQTSKEELELALAWVNDRVTTTQVAAALNVKTGGIYPFLANVLKRYLQEHENV